MSRAVPDRPGEAIPTAEPGVTITVEPDGTLTTVDLAAVDVTLTRMTAADLRCLAQQALHVAAHLDQHYAVGDRCTHISL